MSSTLIARSRSSTDSESSHSSNSNRPSRTSLGQHSTSALVLVPNDDDDELSLSFSDDEDQDEGEMLVREHTAHEPALPTSVVFTYLLAPCLKLGAILILCSQASLRFLLFSLVTFALLAIFARQIWFLLTRYVRKSDLGDIVADAVAKGRGTKKEKVRNFIKSATHFLGIFLRLLLVIVYLRGAIDSVEPFLAEDLIFIPNPLLLAIIFTFLLLPFCGLGPLSNRWLSFVNSLSVVLYITWLCVVIIAHTQGSLDTDSLIRINGRLLQDYTAAAFAFASVSTVQLYTGMVGHSNNNGDKEKRFSSISTVSLSATLLGLLLVFPLVFPQVKQSGHDHEPYDDPTFIQGLLAILSSFILLTAIPPLISSSPRIPLPLAVRRYTNQPLGRYLLLLLAAGLTQTPTIVIGIIEDLAVTLLLLSTYFVPALLHIIFHYLRRPLSIIVNAKNAQRPNRPSTSSQENENNGAVDPDTEELLLRKERALQRRRLGRRILWDLGVWVLLIPVGGGGLAWAVGRMIGVW